jgi:hypothetical protein
MSQILRFTTNIPEEVALRSTSGKRVEGRYGEQIMYNLFDDRVMYVPLIVADRIRELDIGSGEPFEVCKAEVRDGNRRWIEWRVNKLEDSKNSVAPGDASGRESTASPNNGNGTSNGYSNGKSRSQFTATPEGALVPVPVGGPAVAIMETALNAAAEIVQRVASRAAFNNQPLQFTSEDVRAIGLTIYIQAMRDGSAPWRS